MAPLGACASTESETTPAAGTATAPYRATSFLGGGTFGRVYAAECADERKRQPGASTCVTGARARARVRVCDCALACGQLGISHFPKPLTADASLPAAAAAARTAARW